MTWLRFVVRKFGGQNELRREGQSVSVTDFKELEARISKAFDRLGRGIEVLQMQSISAAALDAPDQNELSAALSALQDEQLANQQLKERVQTLKARIESLREKLDAAENIAADKPDEEMLANIAAQDAALTQLRSLGASLRANNDALRKANAEGQFDVGLTNAALELQLEQTLAEREAERLEMQGILDVVRPLLQNAPETEAE
jgi:vacuolar-type H+-ATPase subunit I/STV1